MSCVWSLRALRQRVLHCLNCCGARGIVFEQVVVVVQLGQSSCIEGSEKLGHTRVGDVVLLHPEQLERLEVVLAQAARGRVPLYEQPREQRRSSGSARRAGEALAVST